MPIKSKAPVRPGSVETPSQSTDRLLIRATGILQCCCPTGTMPVMLNGGRRVHETLITGRRSIILMVGRFFDFLEGIEVLARPSQRAFFLGCVGYHMGYLKVGHSMLIRISLRMKREHALLHKMRPSQRARREGHGSKHRRFFTRCAGLA